ncbi:MAG: DMT family transporter [Bordetella sp.]|nr:DMT family transporter [Bordetella sp.]
MRPRRAHTVSTLPSDSAPVRTGQVYAQLMLVMATWGVNLVAVKYLTSQMDIYVVAAIRIVVAFAAVSAFVLLKKGRIPRLTLAQAGWLAAAGVLVVYAHQIALVSGLRMTTAANATLIMATSPLWSVVLAAVFYRERLTSSRIGAAALGLGGVALVVAGSGGQVAQAGAGDLLALFAVIVFVFGGLVIQRVSRALDPLTILWWMYLVGAISLTLHAALSADTYRAESWSSDLWPWVVVVFSAVIASGVCNLLWNAGIARLGMSRAAMFVNWLPIFGLLAAAIFLGERITLLHLAGLACVLSGTWLGLRPAPAAPATR